MKYLIISFLLFAGCMQEIKQEAKIELDASLNITKTEAGFNIYSNTGELILEYTKQNCDSASLETLDEIYQTAKEFYSRPHELERPNLDKSKNRTI